MDEATERELYELAAFAQKNGLRRALKWLMRAMQQPRPRPRKKVRVRLPGGGSFFLDRERLGRG